MKDFIQKYFVYIYLIITWTSIVLACVVHPLFLLGLLIALALFGLVFYKPMAFLLFAPFFLHAQTRAIENDTAYGVALVIDSSMYDISAPLVVKAYCVSSYQMIIGGKGEQMPRVVGVKYYSYHDCKEIPFRNMFTFKQR